MAVASTGFFDGVHLGHRAVIETLLETARQRSEQSLVITFACHPRLVLQQDARSLRLLSSAEEKAAMLRSMGVDRVEVLPFTREFAAMTARQYVEFLSKEYGVDCLVLGYDNTIGSDRLGAAEVKEFFPDSNVVEPKGENGAAVSSTRIRAALENGDVALAASMLGRPYTLSGVVVSGNRMGRTIGFPTANLKLREPLKQIPGVGAFLSRVVIGAQEYWGMTNVDHNGKIETHIFNFSEDIYGLDITVSFEARLREEKKFGSFEDLKAQLLLDMQAAKRMAGV